VTDTDSVLISLLENFGINLQDTKHSSLLVKLFKFNKPLYFVLPEQVTTQY